MTTTAPPPTDAPLMLSVSGARGIVGRTMTPAIAADFAAAFGTFLKQSTGDHRPLLCLGRDSRPSGEMLMHAAAAGLTAVGCRVIKLGIVTTPTVAVMNDHHRAAGGMAITASHNPIMWNGLKCLNADGVAPPADQARQIIERFQQREIDYAAVEDLFPIEEDNTGHERHTQRVLEHIDGGPIRATGFKVALDSVNGAGCIAGRMLLEKLGCEVVHLNGEPTGFFAHTPEPTAENLTELASITRKVGAVCGFAQDPDADRLAIIDDTGRYIGEEYTLVLAVLQMLRHHTGPAVLAANLSTSRMIDDIAAQRTDVKVLRTAVGEANVVASMKPANGLIGGEGNGGVIFPPVCWVRDSLSSMALVLALLAEEKKPLSTIVNALPRYAMIKHKFDLVSVGGRDAIEPAMQRVRQQFAHERINDADGVRVDFADGWVHLRPSNTEPIVRLIAEAETEDRAWELIRETQGVAGL